eukprot:8592593-Karenia_brevis.AAC.1
MLSTYSSCALSTYGPSSPWIPWYSMHSPAASQLRCKPSSFSSENSLGLTCCQALILWGWWRIVNITGTCGDTGARLIP